MTYRTRTRLFWVSVAAFLLVAPPVLFYATGWRITSDFDIERTGGLFIAIPESGSKVYVDGEFERETNFLQSGTLIQNLTPREHSVLVAKNGYWPWTKRLPVTESAVAEARALLVPQTIDGMPVALATTEYATARAAIAKAGRDLATSTADVQFGRIEDRRGRAAIWWDAEERIWIAWTADSPLPYYLDQPRKIIFQSRSPLAGISFYPGRDDVILLAAESGIFALEIDARGTQNFQPIYKGIKPSFARVGNDLYILDQEAIIKIEL